MYRINQAISRLGLATRREADILISEKKVILNSKIVEDFSQIVNIGDSLIINGKSFKFYPPKTEVIMFYKPKGCLTTKLDSSEKKTVFDIIPSKYSKYMTIGRLDFNTEGLLLLTNDGEFARFMELPSSDIKRVYSVRAHGFLNPIKFDKIVEHARSGVTVDGVKYGKVIITAENLEKIIATDRRTAKNHNLQVTVFEGKKNEVRKLMSSFGLSVNRLIRKKFGDFYLQNIEIGQCKKVEISKEMKIKFEKYLQQQND